MPNTLLAVPNVTIHPSRASVPTSYYSLNGTIREAINPLIATLKPKSNGPSHSSTVIGTLGVDRWAVTFGTAKRGLGGAAARPGPCSLYQM